MRVEVGFNGDEVTVSVEDTGLGISEEDLPFIFDRSYRMPRRASQPGLAPDRLSTGAEPRLSTMESA